VSGAHHNPNTNDIRSSLKSLNGNGLSVSQDPESFVGTINILFTRFILGHGENKDEKKSFNSGPTEEHKSNCPSLAIQSAQAK